MNLSACARRFAPIVALTLAALSLTGCVVVPVGPPGVVFGGPYHHHYHDGYYRGYGRGYYRGY